MYTFHFNDQRFRLTYYNKQIISDGPLKAELRFEHKISDVSSIAQVISLTCISERLEFANIVDWHESHQFLVGIHNAVECV